MIVEAALGWNSGRLLAEGRDRAMDEAGLSAREGFCSQARQMIHHARPIVLQHDIGRQDELACRRLRAGSLRSARP